MKVYLGAKAAPAAGGMYRVYDQLFKELPKHGIEIVDTIDEADVVHLHIAVDQEIPADKPLVVSSHGMWWSDIWGDTEHSWGVNSHLIEAYRVADIVTAPSQMVADAIRRNMLIPVKVVRHGIDLDEWQSGESQGYVFWNKARVDPANDPRIVNELARLNPDVQFITTFGEPADNVRVIGRVSPNEIKSILQGAGVYLDTAFESGGPCYGVLEAAACQVPILAWNEGGNAEFVQHLKTGYLAQPGNIEDLSNGLKVCLSEGKTFGILARKAVENNYRSFDTTRGYIGAFKAAILAHQRPVKVSIIVPTYNLGKYLPACLDSLITQTFTDWEAIVVNDASPDDSLQIAQNYATRDSRIKVVNNPTNVHVSEARNIGVLNSHGKYILPLDADDRLTETALQVMVEKLDSTRHVDIVSGTLMLYQDGYFEGDGPYQGWPNHARYDAQIAGLNRLPYASMYRRKVWENLGGYRRRIRTGIEDGDFWTRALSFGYRAEILQHHTLKYTIRANSLRTANPYGVDAWLTWFPWSQNPDLTPFGALGILPDNYRIESLPDRRNGPYKVLPERPAVSVIIPVGPGHAHHIQGCVDSLIAQLDQRWEAVVINDTGERWFDDDGTPLTHYVLGMPFVHFIDGNKSEGVAAARNKGILSAKADKIIFLDVDDVAQPGLVSVLLQSHALRGGWIYGDWITSDGKDIKSAEAPDWDSARLANKMLAPITGLYEKQHLLEVGMFDEKLPGWEDWELQLKLLEKGICATRVAYPLITYNMHLGARREDNFDKSKELVQLIDKRHYEVRRKDMGCSRCGGGKTLSVTNIQKNADTTSAQNSMVWMRYTGSNVGTTHWKSKNLRGVVYPVNNREPFSVFSEDVNYFLNIKYFELAGSPTPTQPVSDTMSIPLVSHAPAQMSKPDVSVPLHVLELDPEIITLLSSHFSDTKALRQASDSDLLQIRGIGEARLRKIRKALKNV